MHGRVKVKVKEEDKKQKEKEDKVKVWVYQSSVNNIFEKRNEDLSLEARLEQLKKSSEILIKNPDVYTLWNHRKEELLHFKATLTDDKITSHFDNELTLLASCIVSNPKSYSVWHHRYWVLGEHLKPDWNQELNFCNKYLEQDDRNFHAWDYRRLVLDKTGLDLPHEMQFTSECLSKNFSNYSSWHYRSTLADLDTEKAAGDELKLVTNAVFTDPNDSSPWFYLNWVIRQKATSREQLEELAGNLEELLALDPDSRWAMMALCSIGEILGDFSRRKELYARLIELDPLRANRYRSLLKTELEKDV